MTLNFLLSSKARTLSPIKMAQLSDSEARALLCQIRWGGEENVVCPKCGVQHIAYRIVSRNQWRCKHCNHTFSVTSGTIFADRKLSIQIYLYAIVLFVNKAYKFRNRDLCKIPFPRQLKPKHRFSAVSLPQYLLILPKCPLNPPRIPDNQASGPPFRRQQAHLAC